MVPLNKIWQEKLLSLREYQIYKLYHIHYIHSEHNITDIDLAVSIHINRDNIIRLFFQVSG